MQNLNEVEIIIDTLEERIKSYSDRTLWTKSNDSTDWYQWILDNGPVIVASWRELASYLKLMSGDQLLELQARMEQIQLLLDNQDALRLAMKMRKVAPPEGE